MNLQEKRILEKYESVDEYIREDIEKAARWARETLTNHEGSGHIFQVSSSYSNPGFVECSFAKPEWGGDHCSRPMELGSEAIVMAVCEYLCGA